MKEQKKFLTTQDIVLIAVFTALIAICSWICINIGPVPFTLQTFAIFVIAGLLGTKRGMLTIIIYILLGLAGVPVFAGFSAGPAAVIGPAGGYLFGFIFTALIIGTTMKVFQNRGRTAKLVSMGGAMIVGDAVCFAVGTVWFMIVTESGLIAALLACVTPYIVPDFIKMIIAVILVDRIKKYVDIFH